MKLDRCIEHAFKIYTPREISVPAGYRKLPIFGGKYKVKEGDKGWDLALKLHNKSLVEFKSQGLSQEIRETEIKPKLISQDSEKKIKAVPSQEASTMETKLQELSLEASEEKKAETSKETNKTETTTSQVLPKKNKKRAHGLKYREILAKDPTASKIEKKVQKDFKDKNDK